MAYVPGCSADVFISYARSDNHDGWVAKLREKLTQKLNTFLASRAEVWFDDRIRPGDPFKEEIQDKLRNTPVFVAVVSPSYIASDFCVVHELEYYQNSGGKEIIQLIKVPLEEGQEVPVPDAHYVSLFDPQDGHALTWNRLEKYLDEIVDTIRVKLRECWEIRPKIYVAQVRNPALREGWDRLKDAIHQEGYGTLPKYVLQERVPDNQIRKWLEAGQVSVHLGSGATDQLAVRQLEIAKQLGQPMLVLPNVPFPVEYPSVISDLQNSIEAGREPGIYLIYDHHSDAVRVSSLRELIRESTKFDVFSPEAGEAYHKFRLRVSDGILLFRNEAPEDWFKSQTQSLLQAAALRGDRFVPEAWYFVRRASGQPARVQALQGPRHEWIIERTGEPDLADLQPFLSALRAAANNAGGALS